MTIIVNGSTGITYPDNTTQASAASGGGGLTWQTVVTSNSTVSSGNAYAISTVSGPVYITLPSSPGAGNAVQLTDFAGTWSANNVVIVGNGANIQGATANVTLSTNRQSVSLVYINAAQGWIPYGIGAGIGSYSLSYLLAGGGGGGGGGGSTTSGSGGGGGAGGYLTGTVSVTPGVAYTITVGSGGASVANGIGGRGGSGGNTSGFSATAIGGGGGSTWQGSATSGGSGGGADGYNGGAAGPAAGTAGQGYAGGSAFTSGANYGGVNRLCWNMVCKQRCNSW